MLPPVSWPSKIDTATIRIINSASKNLTANANNPMRTTWPEEFSMTKLARIGLLALIGAMTCSATTWLGNALLLT